MQRFIAKSILDQKLQRGGSESASPSSQAPTKA